MRYVAAYLLAVLGGNASPSNADIEKILSSVGIEADSTRVTKVVNELKGKSVEELIASGREKLSSMPAGGAAPAAGAGAAAGGAAAAPAEEKKEEKKEESESEDDDMGFGLFE
ncbi:AAEL014583-PB [Aedes aegypti]|uniref:Large ribosomal subunit protein P2 n=3 Tax=Stegomyia TaxID=53541 RepID=Q16FZ2_AEDAE|nr:60S acidic ribosomal protein P2 [Aedes aegypti]XP_001649059.1 60S acidic ribosomal protein P2 [Aedes aegypti]XP_019552357.1 60S acidic ribosomal protein P2 isoform X2 [Aedes albopictus]XP_019552358.1 60S acidic ribosomal protein P2 isoform X2 [Aedes albopictus]XP_019559771.2 60S acidic ribosomal protein P2-like [Aedes albopictus]XP_019559772.2 60S acidic ribosomal protein P2-like [Aedes albopictus]ABF18098.1 60S acidic ribosomal protein P2 [Aedes aegypti]EAT33155.1 AAEL014583-PA [Aedes ae